MTPRKSSVGELLNEYQRFPLKLPEFQRPFSWEKTQVATFWGDLIAFRERYEKNSIDAEYFLGPVVLMETKTEITILDGQQRLATATIFLTQLANAQQSSTKEVGMDKANVEHIFPQNADAAWPNRSNLEPFIWHVGNLAILGKRINNKAKNKSFTDKCNEHYSKSEIKMTKDLLKETSWDEATIRKRAKALAKIAIQVWK